LWIALLKWIPRIFKGRFKLLKGFDRNCKSVFKCENIFETFFSFFWDVSIREQCLLLSRLLSLFWDWEFQSRWSIVILYLVLHTKVLGFGLKFLCRKWYYYLRYTKIRFCITLLNMLNLFAVLSIQYSDYYWLGQINIPIFDVDMLTKESHPRNSIYILFRNFCLNTKKRFVQSSDKIFLFLSIKISSAFVRLPLCTPFVLENN
jgi:hypothetical protein